MRVFLIDRKKSDRALLINLLTKCHPGIVLSGEAESYREAIEHWNDIVNNTDVLFVDIKLGCNKSSFDLLREMKAYKGCVVFVTANKNYALEAFAYGATHYLMKPVREEMVKETVERIKKSQLAASLSRSFEHPSEKLPVYLYGKWEMILLEHITYIQANGSYSNIYVLHNTKPLVASRPIKYFEQKLGQNKDFVRIQKSYLINKKYVMSVSRNDYKVILSGYIEIPVGGGMYRNIIREMLGNH
jgi:two-component system LytT family response regulator